MASEKGLLLPRAGRAVGCFRSVGSRVGDARSVRLSVALAIFCVTTACYGAKKHPESGLWSQEPTSFLGIKLDQNLTDQLEPCPSDYSIPDKVCYQRPFQGYYPLFALPPIGLRYSGGVMTYESQIRGISLRTWADDYETVRAMLIERYGKPILISTETVKTKIGASFQNEKLVWEGERVVLRLNRYSDTIDKSSISLTNKSVATKAAQAGQGKLLDNASKL